MIHQPKGGVCTACIHALRKCNHLPFRPSGDYAKRQ